MGHYKINPLVMLGVPTLMDRPISWAWMDRYFQLSFPLGASVARCHPKSHKVAEARNLIVENALRCNADYVFFLADDVLVPAKAFEVLLAHRKDIVTGVYWTKAHPTQPYIWKDLMKGHYNDWKMGEFFEVDWAGCDCLLVHTDVFKKIEPPWFSTDWTFQEGTSTVPVATEDLYFYTKTRKAGYKVWCDSGVQCDHEDRRTGIKYGLTDQMPQYKETLKDWKWYPKGNLIADVGCGKDTPFFGKDTKVVRIDADPKVIPNILCDIRKIPQPKETFDVVHSRHVLEHFPPIEHKALVEEWIRILKIGGELVLCVPNLADAARQVLEADKDPNYNSQYAFWQIYGNHTDHEDHEFHKCGFTQHGLRNLLQGIEHIKDIGIKIVNNGQNIEGRATKKKSSDPFSICANWVGSNDFKDENGNGKKEAPVKSDGLIVFDEKPIPPKSISRKEGQQPEKTMPYKEGIK